MRQHNVRRDAPRTMSRRQRNYEGQGGAPKDSPVHADAADAVPDHGSVAAFVELVHLDALLEVEAHFLESSVTAIEHPKRLQAPVCQTNI